MLTKLSSFRYYLNVSYFEFKDKISYYFIYEVHQSQHEVFGGE